MAIVVSKTDNDSRLQARIDADLRNRVQNSESGDADLSEDIEYKKDLKKTGRFSWVWIVLFVLAAVSLVFIIFL